jgi:glycosyltransferase involved in cell wall biosynthesis
MKIVFVITRTDTIGGAHVHVRDMASALRAEGHQAEVVSGGAEGPFTVALKDAGVPSHLVANMVRPINPIRDVLALIQLHRLLKRLAPDVISLHSGKAGWLGRLAGRLLGIPVVFTAHGWTFAEGVSETRRKFYRLAERVAAPLATRIITVSRQDRDFALAAGVGTRAQIVAVPNGMADLPASCRASPENEPVRLIMVARYEAQKDHRTLIRALASIADRPWTMELVGGGPGEPALRSLIERHGLSDRVAVHGLRGDVTERLAESQAFVLISNWEGLPRSILEAMRAGLPVVASDVGGVREAVVEGQTGYLVPRGDGAGLAERLAALLEDPARRKAMGQAGRDRYHECFRFERMYRETLRVYRSMLEVTDRPTPGEP